MDEWIEYYDSAPPIYVSKAHREAHYRLIADAIIGYIPAKSATVLDYGCGEALFAADVAARCERLILAEPAPGVRGRLNARFALNTAIKVRAPEELRLLPDGSVDLAVMISVAQYMSAPDFDSVLATMKRLLKPTGRFVIGDVLRPHTPMSTDVVALLRFASAHGFLADALWGLARTAFSDYGRLRRDLGLTRFSEADMIGRLTAAGFSASRATVNIGHNQARMTFVARPALRDSAAA